MKTLEKFPGESSKKEEEQLVPHFNFPEVKDMTNPILDMVKEMREEINNEEYDTLISDDASGRLPTLTLRKIIQSKIEETHPDLTPVEAREKLKTFFVTGGGHTQFNRKELLEFFKKIKPDIKKKALLVTEFISTGQSMATLTSLLEEAGIPFDVASMTVYEGGRGRWADQEGKDILKNIEKKHKLFVGIKGPEVIPEIWNALDLVGVEKGNKPSAHPKVRSPRGLWAQAPEKITKAREDVDTLAKYILQEMRADNK